MTKAWLIQAILAMLLVIFTSITLGQQKNTESELVLLRKMVTSQENLILRQDQLLSDYADEMAKLKAKCAEK